VNDIFIAIDPGKNGGIAWAVGGKTNCIAMPESVHELVGVLRGIMALSMGDIDCVLERVHAMPTDGGRAAFSFGENYGQIQGVLATLAIPYRFTTPQQWQAKVGGLPKGADKKKERKDALKAYALQRFPHLGKKVTLKTSDALAMLAVEDQ
jgi:hypothetical protein